jgi:hypothetical protein
LLGLDPNVAGLVESESEGPETRTFARFARLRWHDPLRERGEPG